MSDRQQFRRAIAERGRFPIIANAKILKRRRGDPFLPQHGIAHDLAVAQRSDIHVVGQP